MYKIILLLLGLGFFNLSFSQQKYSLSGRIVDSNQNPLPGASIFLMPSGQGTVADAKGYFSIPMLENGSYRVEVKYLGYQNWVDTLLVDANLNRLVELKPQSVELQEVVVWDHRAEKRKQEESLSIEIVTQDFIKQNLGGSLMQSLERLPGVSTIDIGSGQSKPVIRGLSFNRVVVVEHGLKHEGQQWGADHGLEVDQYAVENVEIIKGPSSLTYGSDALGGVIDLKSAKIPAPNSLGGSVDIIGKSNNQHWGSSVALYGRKKYFFVQLRATALSYADYRVPVDSVDIYSYRAGLHNNNLRNTAGNEQSIHLNLGWAKDYFQSKIFVSHLRSEAGFFANAHGLEPRHVNTEIHDASNRDILDPYHQVQHTKIVSNTQWRSEKLKYELILGFQRNLRHEWSEYVNHGYMPDQFPDSLYYDPNLELQFDKKIYAAKFKVDLGTWKKWNTSLGFNGDFQHNEIGGRAFIIPAFDQWNAGIFGISQRPLSANSILQWGLRFDGGQLNSKAYYDWFPSPEVSGADTHFVYLMRADHLLKNFSSFSASLGYSYFTDQWLLKINAGKSFRMPNAKELAANGVNYHHFSYEVGNANLKPESSYQLDLGMEYDGGPWIVGASPFVNFFANYIYLNPTSQYDRLYGNGNQEFNYTQSNVFRVGGEVYGHVHLMKNLLLGMVGEYVFSRQLSGDKEGFSLPFSPPASGIVNVKYTAKKFYFFESMYFNLDVRFSAQQNQIVPPEEVTDGYVIFNFSWGSDIKIKNQKIELNFQIQNLTNTVYFNHTSYYRLINVPEAGRNFVVSLRFPFQT